MKKKCHQCGVDTDFPRAIHCRKVYLDKFKYFYIHQEDIFYCKKCKNQTDINKVSDEEGDDHKFCIGCGAPYEQTKIKLTTDDPILSKTLEIIDDKGHFDFISNEAREVIMTQAHTYVSRFLNLKHYDEFQLVQKEFVCSLVNFWVRVLMVGYCAWISERILSGDEIKKSTISHSESFSSECIGSIQKVTMNIWNNLRSVDDDRSTVARTLFTLAYLIDWDFYSTQYLGVGEYVDIFGVGSFFEAICGGWAIAIEDRDELVDRLKRSEHTKHLI